MELKIMVCENSLEGVFSAIFEAYELKCNHNLCELQIGEPENYRLFADYHEVKADEEKAARVIRTVIEKFGQDVYYDFCLALATEDAERGTAVYQTIVYALNERKQGRNAQSENVQIEHGQGKEIQSRRIQSGNYQNRNYRYGSGATQKGKSWMMDHLAVSCVTKVFELSRYAQNEVLHLKGFVRFQELENGILFSRIGPRNNVVTFIAPHFSDRFPQENFVIYDEDRQIFIVHPAGKSWSVVTGEALNEEVFGRFSEKEKEYQELFRYFCEKIAIKERRNLALQRQMLPLRFQEFMTEFKKNR